MAKSFRALSGAAKDAYLRRALAAEPGLDDNVGARLAARLQGEIALVSLKRPPREVMRSLAERVPAGRVGGGDPVPDVSGQASGPAQGSTRPASGSSGFAMTTERRAATSPQAEPPPVATTTSNGRGGAAEGIHDREPDATQVATSATGGIQAPPHTAFDPYSPNVIVVIRTRGREAVLEQLLSIDDVECLRLLAREQQLGISGNLRNASEIRLAIVAAAERRIANRRAAAS